MRTKLMCGFAKNDITPKPEQLPYLRGLMKSEYGAIHDPLMLRVMAVESGESRCLLIGFDLDKALDPEIHLDAIAEKYGIPVENILFYGIHTHSAPIIGLRPGEPVMNNLSGYGGEVKTVSAQYAQSVAEALHETIDAALSNLQPVRIGYATGNSYLNVNRNEDFLVREPSGGEHIESHYGINPEGHVDTTLFVMRVETLQGEPVGFLVNYPVHNVVMFENTIADGKMAISSDMGGNVSRLLEERYRGCTALWTSGAAGDLNPLYMQNMTYPSAEDGSIQSVAIDKGHDGLLQILASRHFADVLKVNRKIVCDKVSGGLTGAIDWVMMPSRNIQRKENGEIIILPGDGEKPYRVRCQLLKIGSLAILGISGELFSSYGMLMKNISPSETTIVVNHNASFLNPDAGYILDEDMLKRPGMHSARTRIKLGTLAKAFRDIVLGLHDKTHCYTDRCHMD